MKGVGFHVETLPPISPSDIWPIQSFPVISSVSEINTFYLLLPFSYMTVDSFQRGIFTWPMNFGWKPIPPDVIEKNKIKESDIIR